MKRLLVLIGAFAVLLGGSATATATTAAQRAAAAPCSVTWGSLPEEAGALSTATVLEARTGQHECWDRVVFEFSAPADGYRVAYGDVYTEGQGLHLNPYVAGGALDQLFGVHLGVAYHGY